MGTNLDKYGIDVERVIRNAPPARLYEEAITYEAGTAITSTGALIARSGDKTGRSPKDKRIVDHPDSREDIWWGDINIGLSEHVFLLNRQRARDYMNTHDRIYVFDGYAGWDPEYRLKVRVISNRAYHALFMHNMLIRPTEAQLQSFGDPDFIIYNAGKFPANPYTEGMTSPTSIDVSFEHGEMVILGT